MITFKDFLLIEQKELPFDHSPHVGYMHKKKAK